MTIRRFSGKKYEEVLEFCYRHCTLSEKIWLSDKNYSIELSQLHFECPFENFEKVFFHSKIVFFCYSSWIFNGKLSVFWKNQPDFWENFGILTNFIGRIVKTLKSSSYVSIGTFGRDLVFCEKKMFFCFAFRTFRDKTSASWHEIFMQEFQKWFLFVHRNFFREKVFLRKFFWIVFGHWAQDFQPSDRNISRGSKNCDLRVQRRVLRRDFFPETKFALFLDVQPKVFEHWTKIWSFDKKFSTMRSELQPTFP